MLRTKPRILDHLPRPKRRVFSEWERQRECPQTSRAYARCPGHFCAPILADHVRIVAGAIE
jgi:hypothetical protein